MLIIVSVRATYTTLTNNNNRVKEKFLIKTLKRYSEGNYATIFC